MRLYNNYEYIDKYYTKLLPKVKGKIHPRNSPLSYAENFDYPI